MPLVHVNGLPNKVGREVLTDVVKPKYENEYFDFSQMTDGEMHLQLKAAQFRLLKASFPNHQDSKLWEGAESMYMNAIYKGVHGVSGNTGVTGYLPRELYEIQSDILQAAKRFSPAGDGQVLVKRSNVGIGADPIIQWTDFKECDVYKKFSMDGYDKCISNLFNDKNREWKYILNQHLERSSHHVLYEFCDDLQAAKLRPTTAWKVGMHQQSVSMISQVSKLSRSNITEWHRLGVMRHNALKGVGALPPQQTINILFDNQDATFEKVLSSLKDPETGKEVTVGFIPIAAYIIFACAAALTAIAGVIQAINKQEPTALDRLGSIGSALFSAQGGDNRGKDGKESGDSGDSTNTGNGGNGGNNGNGGTPPKDSFLKQYQTELLVGGGGLAALYLLNSNSK